jgi:hypothetical protein
VSTASPPRARKARRRRIALCLGAVGICLAGALTTIALTEGLGEFFRGVFGTRWIEAETTGNRFTPRDAARRYLEKIEEGSAGPPAGPRE